MNVVPLLLRDSRFWAPGGRGGARRRTRVGEPASLLLPPWAAAEGPLAALARLCTLHTSPTCRILPLDPRRPEHVRMYDASRASCHRSKDEADP